MRDCTFLFAFIEMKVSFLGSILDTDSFERDIRKDYYPRWGKKTFDYSITFLLTNLSLRAIH